MTTQFLLLLFTSQVIVDKKYVSACLLYYSHLFIGGFDKSQILLSDLRAYLEM